MLNEAVAGRSAELLRSASTFPAVRERALLLIGKFALERGDARSAAMAWREAAALGESAIPAACLQFLRRHRQRASLARGAARLRCPNPDCLEHGRPGGRNIQLVRLYGRSDTPLWTCTTCGCRFTSRRGTLEFRLRTPSAQLRSIITGLLDGDSVTTTAKRAGCTPGTVRRVADRITAGGPETVDDIARLTGRSRTAIRRALRSRDVQGRSDSMQRSRKERQPTA
jgi:hypothetical protein